MNTNILEYLEKAHNEYPEKIAYVGDEEHISFEEVYQKAKSVGSALCQGMTNKRPVLVLSGKNVITPILYLGVAYAGCFYIPLSADLPAFRLKLIMDMVQADILLTDGEHSDILDTLNFSGTILSYSDINNHDIDENNLALRRKKMIDTDPLYVIFTSGSSGAPKGVLTSHRAVIDYINVFAKTFDITGDDVLGNQAPLDYIAAIRDIFLPLYTGAKTVLIPKTLYSTPQRLFDYVNENKITTLCWVAAALALCSELNAFNDNKLEYVNKVIFTGSALSCKHLKVWQENIPNALYANHYGPTEITASCTYYIVDKMVAEADVLPIGIPFDNTEIILLSEDNTETPAGEMGEICVRGSSLALGYYNNPEKTKEVFINNPLQNIYEEIIYKTGDLGKIMPDGNLSFHGRKDFQVKHMGHRIELGEIEEVVDSMEAVSNCVCLYKQEKEMIYLFYAGELTKRDIAVYLRERLPGYMIPRKFIKLEMFPQNFNGKVDLEALKKMM